MSEKQEKVVYVCTHAGEDSEKAAMPFVMALAAVAMEIETMICLQGTGVYLALKGYAETMSPPGGFPPLTKLLQDYLDLGGKLRVCVPCIKDRNIQETDLIEGAETTAAGKITIAAIEADAVFVY
ncbi:MAG: DsrE family protein [Desulfohalobiaceae bacterium]|nr:DsrE family protein [Desulfohalobiaceae bacterium]